MEITNEEYDFIMDINVRGTMLTNQAAYITMAEQGYGNIINFGSDTGLVGAPGQAIYGASKAAVMSWTRTIANEWGRIGIRSNSVIPAIATPMFEEYKAKMNDEELAMFNESMKHTIPLGGQLGDPDKDLAPVMVFLASDDTRFMNGQIISVNGGLGSVR